MPIYAYKCSHCGATQEVLQKVSDPLLTDCPVCAKPTLSKQVTAAGFQLKGSGWYVTDFRDGSKKQGDAAAKEPEKSQTTSPAPGDGDAAKASSEAAAPAASSAPPPAPDTKASAATHSTTTTPRKDTGA